MLIQQRCDYLDMYSSHTNELGVRKEIHLSGDDDMCIVDTDSTIQQDE